MSNWYDDMEKAEQEYEAEMQDEAYQQGRADTIDELDNIFKEFFTKQNNPKSKFRPSIVMMEEDALSILKQLKEQTE